MKMKRNSNKQNAIQRQDICHIKRLKIASLWIWILIAILSISLWIGSLSDAKANEAGNESRVSKIWTEIVSGKSLKSAMRSAEFVTDNNKIPEWALEICSEELISQAYIDSDSGVMEFISETDISTFLTNMKSELGNHEWTEISTKDEIGSANKYKQSDISNKSASTFDKDASSEGYVASFIKEKGVARWLTMECVENTSGTIAVLHIQHT